VKVVVKLDAVLGAVARLTIPSAAEWEYFVSIPSAAARRGAPPTPPPQSA
jgi:hypothetical protein